MCSEWNKCWNVPKMMQIGCQCEDTGGNLVVSLFLSTLYILFTTVYLLLIF